MSCGGTQGPDNRLGQFALRADRLINERLCVMVVGRGEGWAEYSLKPTVAPSARVGLAFGLCALVLITAAAISARSWLSPRSELQPAANKPV
jgi:hypothetical protein